MGAAVNGPLMRAMAIAAAGIVMTLNAVLLLDTMGVPVPL
jgi:hypothetical protein